MRTQIRDKSPISSHNATKKPVHHLSAGAVNWRAHPEVSPSYRTTHLHLASWSLPCCHMYVRTQWQHNDSSHKRAPPKTYLRGPRWLEQRPFQQGTMFSERASQICESILPGSGRFHLVPTLNSSKKNYDAVAKARMAELQTYERWIIRYLPCLRDLNTTVMFYLRI